MKSKEEILREVCRYHEDDEMQQNDDITIGEAKEAMQEYIDQVKPGWISIEKLQSFALPDFTEVFGYSLYTDEKYWDCLVMTYSVHPKIKYIMGPGSVKITHFMLPPEKPKV